MEQRLGTHDDFGKPADTISGQVRTQRFGSCEGLMMTEGRR